MKLINIIQVVDIKKIYVINQQLNMELIYLYKIEKKSMLKKICMFVKRTVILKNMI